MKMHEISFFLSFILNLLLHFSFAFENITQPSAAQIQKIFRPSTPQDINNHKNKNKNMKLEGATMIQNENELLSIQPPIDSRPNDSNPILRSTTTNDLNSHKDHMRRTYSGTITYSTVGSQTPWTVPAGVYAVTVDAWGAQGGSYWGIGGLGGYIQAIIPVTPGQVLNVYVGAVGTLNGNAGANSNGGGNGGNGCIDYYPSTPTTAASCCYGYYCDNVYGSLPSAGGGASDVRIGGIRVVVAGGGGGAGYTFCAGRTITYNGQSYYQWYPSTGGNGGGSTGGSGGSAGCGYYDYIDFGTSYPISYILAGGGTQSAGGVGGKECTYIILIFTTELLYSPFDLVCSTIINLLIHTFILNIYIV